MYKIAIENKDGEKYEFECDGTANLYVFTEELGIKEYPYSSKIGENRNGVKVRLKADNDFDESIAKILRENRNTLNDAQIVSRALGEVQDEWMREEIERNALNGERVCKERRTVCGYPKDENRAIVVARRFLLSVTRRDNRNGG